MPKGRCRQRSCGLVYVWDGRPLVRDALCPKHLTPLARTSRLAEVPFTRRSPAAGSARKGGPT